MSRAIRVFTLFCAYLALFGCGGGGSSSPPPAPPPPPPVQPPPITYTISVSAGPESSVASLGVAATATVNWSFSASSATAGAASYTVTSSTEGVQITGGSGSVTPGTAISTQLSFVCTVGGATEAQITLSVGGASESLTWAITCTEETVTFTPLEAARVARNEAALATLVWRFQTTGDESMPLNYEVRAESERLQISNATGSATHGIDIENELRYVCGSNGANEVALSINVGSATQRVIWLVTCTGDAITPIRAKFLQGPLLVTVDFSLVDESWQATVNQLFYFESNTLRLGTNRQLFVSLEYESAIENELGFGLGISNAVPNVTIEQVSASTLAPNLSGTRTNYIRRVVFDVNGASLDALGMLQIQIDPDDAIPQPNEEVNLIEFDVTELPAVELPELKLTLVPMVAVHGEPDLTDTSAYVNALYEHLPIGPHAVKIGAALDVSDQDPFNPDTSLTLLFDRWLNNADRDEFYHGIFKQKEQVEICGLAYVGGNAGITGEIDEFCSANTIAHEVGHNFSLNHAPACGAEDAGPDTNYPYSDGSIATEGGWLMRQRRPVGSEGIQITRVYDLMSYCIETFTSQYSYGTALDYFTRNFGPIAVASKPPRRETLAFEAMEGHGLVLMGHLTEAGEWSLRTATIVAKPALFRALRPTDFELRLVHAPSGTVLHREWIQPMTIAHSETTRQTWGTRIPAFAEDDLLVQILDKEANTVFEYNVED